MKNRKIAEVLKAYRKMNNLSVRDVTELLEEKSLKVAEKTVYGMGNAVPLSLTLTHYFYFVIFIILITFLALSDILTKSQLILQNMNIT